MKSETFSRIVGSVLGAVVVMAGLAAFGSRAIAVPHPEVSYSVEFRVAPVPSALD